MTEASKALSHPADKGKLPLVEANPITLAELNPIDINKTIEVRVYRKWIAKNVKTQVASKFYAILLDREGNAIQANMNLNDTDYFDQLLQLNIAYRISRFMCTKTKLWDRTLPNNTTLVFGKYTSVIPISNADFPEHHFNFIAYNEVDERTDVSGAPLTEKIGMNEYVKLQKPVIIAVSSAWASKRFGEANYILSVYADLIDPTPAWEIQRERCSSQIDKQMRNCHTIESLLSVNPQHYQAIIEDGTATATLTCFSLEAHTFVPDCNTVLTSAEDKDTYHVPVALKQAECQTYIFHYSFGRKARPGYPNFTLDVVLKATAPPLLALPSVETTSSPTAEVLELPFSSEKSTPDTKEPSPSTKDNVEEKTDNPGGKKKPVKRTLFQEADT
ncbi:DNA helicase [Tanacetum coccineum]